MADTKMLNTRIQLKYDTLEKWIENDPILLAGEVAIATITVAATSKGELPPVMFKVGVGDKKFSELDWSAALAADVYAWAKKSAPAVSDFGDIIAAARSGLISADSVVKTLNTLKGDVTLEGDGYITIAKGTNKLTFKLVLSDAEAKALASGINATKVATYDSYQEQIDGKYVKPEDGIPKTDLDAGVKASLGKADSALQSHQTVTLASGTNNGTLKLTVDGIATDNIAVKGLGSAAYMDSSAYATSAQGTKADNAMPKSGGTFTGLITLSGAPTANMHAATKQYVDTKVGEVKQFKYTVASNAATTPVGVVWYSGTTEATKITGTLVASATTEYNIYLVPCKHTAAGAQKGYDEYLTVKNGTVYSWEVIGNTQDVDLHEYAKSADIVPNTRKVAGKALSADITAADLRTALNVADGATKVTETTVSGWGFTKNAGTVKTVTLASGTNNGTLKLTVDGTAMDNIAVKGINAAAYKAVDTSIAASSTSTNLPTSAAVEARINAHKGIDKIGTVTSVEISTTAKGGLKVTGSPVTSSGTINVDIDDEVTFILNCGTSSTVL